MNQIGGARTAVGIRCEPCWRSKHTGCPGNVRKYRNGWMHAWHSSGPLNMTSEVMHAAIWHGTPSIDEPDRALKMLASPGVTAHMEEGVDCTNQVAVMSTLSHPRCLPGPDRQASILITQHTTSDSSQLTMVKVCQSTQPTQYAHKASIYINQGLPIHKLWLWLRSPEWSIMADHTRLTRPDWT